jgi:hypothetical protein
MAREADEFDFFDSRGRLDTQGSERLVDRVGPIEGAESYRAAAPHAGALE